jgi:phosphoenolpyruvate carboxylase
VAEGAGGVRALYRGWPFLRGLVDDARLALTQADVEVASFYAALAAPEDRVVFDRIHEEHSRTVSAILEATGDGGLMTPWPAVARAAERRNPYVDVLSHLQIELLARTRTGPAEDRGRAREALLLTVNGIAAGLQTVG